MLNPKLLEIIVCPLCKGQLSYAPQENTLSCNFDRLVYPIEDGIPILVPDVALEMKNND